MEYSKYSFSSSGAIKISRGGDNPEGILEEEVDPSRAFAHQGAGKARENFGAPLPT